MMYTSCTSMFVLYNYNKVWFFKRSITVDILDNNYYVFEDYVLYLALSITSPLNTPPG